eukprot:scaffold374_cov271-Pinguiococcus_pyrenoidosus.AAC.6
MLQQRVDVFVRQRTLLRLHDLLGAEAHHGHQLVLGELRVLVREAALLNHRRVEEELPLRALNDLLLHRALGHEAEHPHGLGLPDAVRAVHGLQIHLRVPVRVIQHDNVCGIQVDPKAAGSRTQQKGEVRRLRGIELVHLPVAVLGRGAPVDATVSMAEELHHVFQDVQHPRHLAEDEHPGALSAQLGQELAQQRHLAAVRPQVRPIGVRRSGLRTFKEIRVVADLPQLHQDVQHLHFRRASQAVQVDRLLRQDVRVHLALHGRHADEQLRLGLGRQLLLDVLLHPPQHEGLQDGVQLADHVLLPALVGKVEPFVEDVGRVEDLRQEEVQQRPELVEIVL